MAIDECKYSFKESADDRLPALMKKMEEALKHPTPMSKFGEKGVGKATILKHLGKKTDFQGCYVLRDESGPLYVGISRGVIQRLIQHVKGKTHFDASLAYRIATDNYKHGIFGVSRGQGVGFPNLLGVGREEPEQVRDSDVPSTPSPGEPKHEMSRSEAMANKEFIDVFNEAKSCISSMSVAYIEITNDLELYLFEVYCCMRLDTSRWNTFRTH